MKTIVKQIYFEGGSVFYGYDDKYYLILSDTPLHVHYPVDDNSTLVEKVRQLLLDSGNVIECPSLDVVWSAGVTYRSKKILNSVKFLTAEWLDSLSEDTRARVNKLYKKRLITNHMYLLYRVAYIFQDKLQIMIDGSITAIDDIITMMPLTSGANPLPSTLNAPNLKPMYHTLDSLVRALDFVDRRGYTMNARVLKCTNEIYEAVMRLYYNMITEWMVKDQFTLKSLPK